MNEAKPYLLECLLFNSRGLKNEIDALRYEL